MNIKEFLYSFVKESNEIENIFREPLESEINELSRFISLPKITIDEVKKFVSIYEPEAKLRNQYDMNVKISAYGYKYIPPFSCPELETELKSLLENEMLNVNPYFLYITYEKLHPFTDCNGRSGRAIWLNKMGTKLFMDDKNKPSFLKIFHNQSLFNFEHKFKNL